MIEDENFIPEDDDDIEAWDNTLQDGLEEEDFSDNTQMTMDYVRDTLDEARNHKLEVEIVYFALKAMKEDNTLTISEAMASGANEFIK